MNDSFGRIMLLGPQVHYNSLRTALGKLSLNGPVAVVTAGWEEDECQDAELMDSLPVPGINLRLFQRSEQLFKEDPELISQLQRRQDELRRLRDAYRMRLDLAIQAAERMMDLQGAEFDFSPECDSAIEMVRLLDRQYFVRTSQICDRYDQQLQLQNRPQVAEHRHQIHEQLSECQAVLIAGGHSAIILNRLQIFELCEEKCQLPVVAWSGGAMALAEQIVFFHDRPPQGAGNAEVLRAGIGAFHEILPLPDARNRLDLGDRRRIALFARRFDRYRCVILDEHTLVEYRDGRWFAAGQVQRLMDNGTVGDLES
jgi:hypothetical protein